MACHGCHSEVAWCLRLAISWRHAPCAQWWMEALSRNPLHHWALRGCRTHVALGQGGWGLTCGGLLLHPACRRLLLSGLTFFRA